MIITWDEKKNASNFKKHKVWFEEAQTVTVNPLSLMAPNDDEDGDRMEYLDHSLERREYFMWLRWNSRTMK